MSPVRTTCHLTLPTVDSTDGDTSCEVSLCERMWQRAQLCTGLSYLVLAVGAHTTLTAAARALGPLGPSCFIGLVYVEFPALVISQSSLLALLSRDTGTLNFFLR